MATKATQAAKAMTGRAVKTAQAARAAQAARTARAAKTPGASGPADYDAIIKRLDLGPAPIRVAKSASTAGVSVSGSTVTTSSRPTSLPAIAAFNFENFAIVIGQAAASGQRV